jgi:chromosomal replication initiator protein
MIIWDTFLKEQSKEIGYEAVKKWLRPLKIVRFDACNLYLEAEDAFQIMWFKEHIEEKASHSLKNNNGKPIKVHIKVKGEIPPLKKTQEKEEEPQFTLRFDQIDPRFTFPHFANFPSNELTYKVFSKIAGYTEEGAQEPELKTFNPVYLFGSKGLGKTHLLMATAKELQKKGLDVLFVKTETFTEHVVSAIKSAKMAEFREAYRKVDVLIVDDVHLLSNKKATQEEFFHSFNSLHLSNKQIILSANSSPQDLKEIEPRLVSRFEWGITLPLVTPAKEEVLKIILTRAQALDFKLPQKIAEFLVETFTNNITTLNRALEALILRLHLNGTKNPLSISLVKHLLSDLMIEEERSALSPKKILKIVSDYFELEQEELTSPSREKELTKPRHIVCYLCRSLLKMPFIKIGDFIGRDHTTVMSSVKLIETHLKNNDPEYLKLIENIKKTIN